jgi:hypothetical protein
MADNEILCASTPCYHIASRDGNNDNELAAATTFVVNKPLVHHIVLHRSDCEQQGMISCTGARYYGIAVA